MSRTESTLPIEAAIEAELRRLRIEDDRSQEEVAAAMRDLGFDWTRSVVASFENGVRRLRLGELVALTHAYGISLAAVLDRVGYVAISDRTLIWGPDFGDVLSGEGFILPTSAPEAWTSKERIRFEPWIKDPAAPPMETIDREAAGEAEITVARNLELRRVSLVVVAAYRLWGRGLTAERDARARRRAGADAGKESLRVARGHVTRELEQEIAGEIAAMRRRKPATKKRGKSTR